MELLLKHNGNYSQIITCKINDNLSSFGVADLSIELSDGFKEFDYIEIIEVEQIDKIVFK